MAQPDKLVAIVTEFTQKLRAEIEAQTYDRLQSAITSLRAADPAAFGRGGGAAALLGARAPRQASPGVLKARKLQGQYIGALRKLQGSEREQVQAVARDKGAAEGLKLATTILAKRGQGPGKEGGAPKSTARAAGGRGRTLVRANSKAQTRAKAKSPARAARAAKKAPAKGK